MLQVKAINKDVRKMIVPSFMFLFNLSKSIVLCVNIVLRNGKIVWKHRPHC